MAAVIRESFFRQLEPRKLHIFTFLSSSLCTWDARIVPLAPLSWAIFSPVVMCFRLNSNTKRFPQLFSLGSTCTLIKQTSCRKFRENTTHILKIVTYWSVIHQNWMLSGPTCFLENCESWYSLIRRRSEGDLEREVAKQGPLTSESTNVWNKSIARCKYETTGFLHEREEYVFYTRCPGLQSWPFASGSLQQLSDQISTALREHAATLHKHLEDLLLWCTWKHLEVLIHRGTWSSWGMNARFIACC